MSNSATKECVTKSHAKKDTVLTMVLLTPVNVWMGRVDQPVTLPIMYAVAVPTSVRRAQLVSPILQVDIYVCALWEEWADTVRKIPVYVNRLADSWLF